MPTNYRFGGGVAETFLSPIVLAAMVLAIVSILLLPRKWVLVSFLLVGFLTPSGQTLVVAGVHLYVVRIVILVALGRLIANRLAGGQALFANGWTAIDKVFIGWALTRAVAFILLFGRADAVANQCGFLWDSLGGYLLLRFCIQSEEDIFRAAKVFVLIAVVAAIGMAYEQRSMTNIFGSLGGVTAPDIREGKARSQGPFAHAITAGVFGATVVPLFVALWSRHKSRFLAACGILAATTMVVTSASSTPFGAYVGGIFALCLWRLRNRMRTLRWVLVFALCAIGLIMKAPIWFILAHVDLVGGSSSYHRAMLVDTCIRHFNDWWLFGTHDNQTWGWDMWDIQNQFVAEAFRGGLAAFALFLLVITRTFSRVGTVCKSSDIEPEAAWMTWTMGAIIFAHVVAFFGADYFDQVRFWWYASLAFVSACSARLLVPSDRSTAEYFEEERDYADRLDQSPRTLPSLAGEQARLQQV